jgi:hypothetical protein
MYRYGDDANFSDLVGKTITGIDKSDEFIRFETEEAIYVMRHYQNCCEYVGVEDINGDLEDLIGKEILNAYESSKQNKKVECGYWTFYHISTQDVDICIRWYGRSNGYYSVSVAFEKFEKSVEEQHED